jgi:gluconolactonase
LKYTPGAPNYTEFRNPSNRANGLAFDAQGRLLAAEGNSSDGGRRVTRTDMANELATGAVEVLADKFEGKRLNSPNDLVVSQDGRIYFTDPRYGSQDGREIDTEDVYRIDPDGTLTRAATAPDINKPNGIAISPDGKTLYVADTQPGPPREARVMAFAIGEDGSLSNPRKHYSFGQGRGIDGMAIDVEGNIYGAAGRMAGAPENDAGVYIIGSGGELAGFVRVPEDSVTNCNFGGPDLRTLYITAGKTLFSVRVKNQGYLVYPPAGGQ